VGTARVCGCEAELEEEEDGGGAVPREDRVGLLRGERAAAERGDEARTECWGHGCHARNSRQTAEKCKGQFRSLNG